MTIEEIIELAEANQLKEVKVHFIKGIHKATNLILAGPSGPIKIIFINE